MSDRLKIILGHIGAHQTHVIPNPTSSGLSVGTQKYKYTRDSGILTLAQREFYEKNGFVVVRGLVDQNDLEKYRQRFMQVCKGEVNIPGLIKMRDISSKDKPVSEQILNKIQNFQLDDTLFHYCNTPEVVDYVRSIIGPNVKAIHTMLINKPPDVGTLSSRHPMHQDLHYFPHRPADRIVCSWTAMEKVTRQNGCLVVVPGTHQGELLEHGYPKWEGGVNKMYHGIMEYDPSNERIYLEMEPGDTVFFHPILIHGSGANRTKGFRKAISCHYAASECHFADIEKSNIAEEVKAVAVRRLGEEVADTLSYKDIWELNSRLVAGEEDPVQA